MQNKWTRPCAIGHTGGKVADDSNELRAVFERWRRTSVKIMHPSRRSDHAPKRWRAKPRRPTVTIMPSKSFPSESSKRK